MIRIDHKADCCGCSACEQICPKSCISLKEDSEGFMYPDLNKDTCIQCGLCDKVCPMTNYGKERIPLQAFAAKNKDEDIRYQSSSGGVFTSFAAYIITQRHGVVFGAKFNKHWEVVHSYTETMEGLAAFRGSKYVQSRINDSYKQAELFLKQGRFVLFSGTPCQIRGLLLYLRKEYSNLMTIDFICHGVPSPMIWRMFLEEKSNAEYDRIKSISFRDKHIGWKKFSFSISLVNRFHLGRGKNSLSTQIYYYHPFMIGFIDNLYIRPSCFSCKTKSFSSGSDITIADYWGIQKVKPEMDDDKGVSAIMLHTQHALDIYSSLKIDSRETDIQAIILHNAFAVKSATPHTRREDFFTNLHQCRNISSFILRHTLSRKQRIKRTIKLFLNDLKIVHL